MATITIKSKMLAETEEEANEIGVPKLKSLWEKMQPSFNHVIEDFVKKYPDLEPDIHYPDFINMSMDYFEDDVIDDKIIWELSEEILVRASSPNIECLDHCHFSAYDQWYKMGQQKHKNIFEPFYYCDWSSVKSFVNSHEKSDESIKVEFDAVNAVKYPGGYIRFYDNHKCLKFSKKFDKTS